MALSGNHHWAKMLRAGNTQICTLVTIPLGKLIRRSLCNTDKYMYMSLIQNCLDFGRN